MITHAVVIPTVGRLAVVAETVANLPESVMHLGGVKVVLSERGSSVQRNTAVASSGRVSGREFGFAQIVYPCHVWRKGTNTGRELVHDQVIYAGANVRHLRHRERSDRQGRLTGKVIGFREALHGGRPEAFLSVIKPPRSRESLHE